MENKKRSVFKFRQYYLERTGLKLKPSIHIHHIDGDRSNCKLNNLVHLTVKKHIRYHHLICTARNILFNLKEQGLEINDLHSNYVRSSCLIFNPMKNWWDKLYSCESYMIKQMNKRNELTGIEYVNVFITDEEKEVLEIYKKRE